jgi:hypothetical protein
VIGASLVPIRPAVLPSFSQPGDSAELSLRRQHYALTLGL